MSKDTDQLKEESTESKKAKSLELAIGALQKQFGKEILVTGKAIEGVEFYSSGIKGLDLVLGGGFAKGRTIEIYGPESSGKTTIALEAIASLQRNGGKCAFVDAEHALDINYAIQIGVDPDELLLTQPDNGEQALEVVEQLARSGAVNLIVVDSVAALTPQKEIEGDMGDAQMGMQARLMSQAMRKLVAISHSTGCTIIFINQIRMKLGLVFGNPETTTGGNALKFFATQRLDVRRKTVIKTGSGDEEEAVGSKTLIKVVKNKVFPPFKEVEFDIIYGKGVDKLSDILTLAVKANVIDKSGSWYSYKGKQLGQGEEKTLLILRNDPNLLKEITNQI